MSDQIEALKQLGDLGYFLAVVGAGSIAGAARTLGADPSTVSRRVARLEARLGVTLLTRTARGVLLSEPGEQLRARGQAAVNLIALGIDEATRPADVLTGTVRLTAPTEIGTAFITPMLKTLAERHPNIVIELELGARLVDLTRAEADLAVRTMRPTQGDIVVRRLSGRPLHAFHAPTLAASVARLRWLSWIGADPLVEQAMAAIPAARVVMRSNDLAGLRAACVAGMGAALLPDLLGAQLGLPRLADVPPVVGPPLWMAAPRTSLERPRVRAVWQLIQDRFDAYARPR
ncbi:MAG: LysR family transcriptional regulator [Myxococcota bacterium]